MRGTAVLALAVFLAAGCGDEAAEPPSAATAEKPSAGKPPRKRRRAGDPEEKAPAPPPAEPEDEGGKITLKAPEGNGATGVDFRREGPQVSPNGKDLRLSGGLFEARAIADVGESPSLAEAPADARAARPRRVVAALPGHVYLFRASDPDRVLALRVTELTPAGDVSFDWTASSAAHVAAAHFRADSSILEVGSFALQVRLAKQGGATSRVTLEDAAKWTRVKPSAQELDFASPQPAGESAAYTAGGPLPAGEAFLVEAVDVFAGAPESDGHGEVRLRIGGRDVLQLRDLRAPGLAWLLGRLPVFGGHEVVLEAANGSQADVRLHGRFVPVAEATRLPRVEFVPVRAPEGLARAGGAPASTRSFFLLEPRVLLQARAGAVGGNPCRVTMTGRTSQYVASVATAPLAMEAPLSADEKSSAYAEGGLVPRGKVFVVTRVDWIGSAKGDTNGRGRLTVKAMGEKIVDSAQAAAPVEGSWTGRIEVPAGGEETVFVEISNSSSADVRISGEFADAPPRDR